MKFLNWWKNTELDDDLLSLENILGRSLISVVPRQEFIEDLRHGLMNQIPEEVELAISNQKKNIQTGLIVTGGILGGVMIILSGLRGIVSLVGVTALLINWIRQNIQQTRALS
ncbi:MAG TPA: hypothetical protein DEH22_08420 [Chloroflexi bacterium]|nr:hypothetical protein [Chloroflexota bacterium]